MLYDVIPLTEEEYFLEEKLSSEDRNNLKTKTFGLPKQRKYPLNDEKHVISAITYFKNVMKKMKRNLLEI